MREKCLSEALKEIDLQNLETYMAEFDRKGYTRTTRRRKTSSIKSLAF
jgi:site-specific recombinase XerD